MKLQLTREPGFPASKRHHGEYVFCLLLIGTKISERREREEKREFLREEREEREEIMVFYGLELNLIGRYWVEMLLSSNV